MYTYIHVCMYIHIYIYIYIEREREMHICRCIHVYNSLGVLPGGSKRCDFGEHATSAPAELRRGNSHRLANSSPCVGPSAGTDVARELLQPWH